VTEVLGFPAFPDGIRRIPRFARSWWGRAWLAAMEETALDATQLRKGRRFAYGGHVGPITVSPGRLTAIVYGDDGTPYQTEVEVERLSDAQWDRFLGAVAVRAGYLAALLDREVPRELVEAAEDADVPLLPGLGDLQPHCSCPDWEFPCRHAAALCYQSAWLLDADPFVLLLLRGRSAERVLGDLRRPPPASGDPAAGADGAVTGPRDPAAGAGGAVTGPRDPADTGRSVTGSDDPVAGSGCTAGSGDPAEGPGTAVGVLAAEAFAVPVAALPPVPPDPSVLDPDAVLPTLGAGPGVEPVRLRQLVAVAAGRARTLRGRWPEPAPVRGPASGAS
jgi:uncharacterized Zn finger protein